MSDNEQEKKCDASQQPEQLHHLIIPWLETQDLLNYAQVSKTINTYINSFWQKETAHLLLCEQYAVWSAYQGEMNNLSILHRIGCKFDKTYDGEKTQKELLEYFHDYTHRLATSNITTNKLNLSQARLFSTNPTSLMTAVRGRHLGCVEFLLSVDTAKATINQKNSAGVAAIHYAAMNSQLEMLILLHNNGVDLDLTSDSPALDLCGSALHILCHHGENSLVCIEYLIENDANLDSRDTEQKTPLHSAAKYRQNPYYVKTLIEAGADKYATDNSGNKPIDLASNEEVRSTIANTEPQINKIFSLS